MKHLAHTLAFVVAVTLVSVAPARANDEPVSQMSGRVSIIKKGSLAKFIGKPATGQTFDLPDAGNAPTDEGAVLLMMDLGNPGKNEMSLNLPPQAAPLRGSPRARTARRSSPTAASDPPRR